MQLSRFDGRNKNLGFERELQTAAAFKKCHLCNTTELRIADTAAGWFQQVLCGASFGFEPQAVLT